MFYALVSLIVFMISLLGTRLMIIALRQRALLLDKPNQRSNHKVPTPRGGGIAVVFAIIIGLLIDDVNYGIVLSMLLLAAVSLVDDLVNVPAIVRLIVQAAAVSLPLCMVHTPIFGGLLADILPLWADKLLAALLWLWFINLFNFMDGIDGISATEMICLGMGLCIISAITGTYPNGFSGYSLIIAAAGCGFLWWNWHPARIFLGDVGSVPIGFLLGYVLMLAAHSGYAYPAMILPAYYLSDATITLIKRLWKRQRIWVAHSSHYYQKAVRGGRRHDIVARYVFGINMLLLLLATFSVIDPQLAIMHLAIAYMAVFMLLGFFAHTKHDPDVEPLS